MENIIFNLGTFILIVSYALFLFSLVKTYFYSKNKNKKYLKEINLLTKHTMDNNQSEKSMDNNQSEEWIDINCHFSIRGGIDKNKEPNYETSGDFNYNGKIPSWLKPSSCHPYVNMSKNYFYQMIQELKKFKQQSNNKQSNNKQSNNKQSNDKQSNDKQSNDKPSNDSKDLFENVQKGMRDALKIIGLTDDNKSIKEAIAEIQSIFQKNNIIEQIEKTGKSAEKICTVISDLLSNQEEKSEKDEKKTGDKPSDDNADDNADDNEDKEDEEDEQSEEQSDEEQPDEEQPDEEQSDEEQSDEEQSDEEENNEEQSDEEQSDENEEQSDENEEQSEEQSDEENNEEQSEENDEEPSDNEEKEKKSNIEELDKKDNLVIQEDLGEIKMTNSIRNVLNNATISIKNMLDDIKKSNDDIKKSNDDSPVNSQGKLSEESEVNPLTESIMMIKNIVKEKAINCQNTEEKKQDVRKMFNMFENMANNITATICTEIPLTKKVDDIDQDWENLANGGKK